MSKKVKKLLTLEQLVQFCEHNKFYAFSSKDSGYTLSVQVPGNLIFSNEEDEDLLYTTVKVCHTLLNRNGSFISEKNMKKAMPTLKYKPLLASIIEDENGELDFNGHDMEFNEDGTINYIEKQIGTFTVDEPVLEYDKQQDKTYVIANAVIHREYTPAASIIERKNGTKVSCELKINEMQYNAKEKYLELTDFIFSGVCCLGESVGEGMLGSRLDITDFSTENNSLHYETNEELLTEIKKLNENLSRFTIESQKEGGKTLVKFEELLKKYNKTIEDITFEYETLTDEELEEKFEEIFGENTEGEGADPEPTSEGDEENDNSEDEKTESEECENNDDENHDEEESHSDESHEDNEEENAPEDNPEEYSLKCSVTYGDSVKEFSISLSEKINAISTLVNETYESDGTWYYVDVFDEEKYVIMQDCWTGRAFKQSYKVKKDSYSLSGDRVEVYSIFVTEDERKKLEDMRANYSSISEKLAKYEAEPEKVKILNSESYAKIVDTEEFKELKDNHFDLSVEEVSAKADAILLDYAKAGNLNFSVDQSKKKSGMTRLPIQTKSNKKSRYGSLFSK